MSKGPITRGEDVARIGMALIESGHDAVIYADRKGKIRLWNAGATRIFGFSAEEAQGQSLDIIIPERLRERHWAGYDRMMETGQSRYPPDQLLSVPAATKSGAMLSIQFTIAPVTDNEGEVCGLVALLRDVTAMFEELKALRKAADAR